MILGYPTSGMICGLKCQRSRLRLGLGLTAIRRGFALYMYEYPLVIFRITSTNVIFLTVAESRLRV